MLASDHIYSVKDNIYFCLAVPLYLMLFMVLYCPTFGYEGEWITGWGRSASFCLPIISAIEFGVLVVSRSLVCFVMVRRNWTRLEYWIWIFIEFVATVLFVDLFLSLYLHINYFVLLPKIVGVALCLNIFPYFIFFLWVGKVAASDTAVRLQLELQEARKSSVQEGLNVMRFADDKGVVKLSVGVERVISVESSGNYVKVLYDDDGRLMRYMLRTTLKAVEPYCVECGFVRCHRSFLINVAKVKVIRRGPEGVFAEMDHAGVDDIPVSKSYAAELFQIFGKS